MPILVAKEDIKLVRDDIKLVIQMVDKRFEAVEKRFAFMQWLIAGGIIFLRLLISVFGFWEK